ncbi:BON domain-containing protein [Sphingomonas sp. 1P08PE]|uniref:BON domain-containing protein n=1 Tax=Sphingomonas sp. 1P08PE TaxID=554122 RepID=UPI0039A1FBB6
MVEELKVELHPTMVRSDEDIAKAAAMRLDWEVSVPRDAVKIKVENGWVTLTGEVDWHYQKDAAERHIHGLYGVVGVLNETTIKPRADATNIGHNIDLALHRSWFDPKTITVTTQGGKVKLTGSVETPGDRYVAGTTAWGAPGATEVENDLIIA